MEDIYDGDTSRVKPREGCFKASLLPATHDQDSKTYFYQRRSGMGAHLAAIIYIS